MATKQERIEEYLDQLEQPGLSDEDIDKIKRKLEIVQSVDQ